MSLEGQSNLEQEKDRRRRSQSGQLILEYILLMLIAVSMASLIQNRLIGGTGDNIDDAGILSQLVYRVTVSIAADTPGE